MVDVLRLNPDDAGLVVTWRPPEIRVAQRSEDLLTPVMRIAVHRHMPKFASECLRQVPGPVSSLRLVFDDSVSLAAAALRACGGDNAALHQGGQPARQGPLTNP
jgi:hypothetical protein